VTEPQLKGSAYASTFAFIDSEYGAGARERVLARVPLPDREVLGGIILSISWYPLAPFPRLLRAMDAELGSGDLAVVSRRGMWAAINDMKTVHRVLLKLVTPGWLIEKGMRIWSNFHSTGRWEAERLGPKRARATLHDLGVVDSAMCATLGGWIMGLLSMAGARSPQTTHESCRARGDATCSWIAEWK
jgi:hypothetical protein